VELSGPRSASLRSEFLRAAHSRGANRACATKAKMRRAAYGPAGRRSCCTERSSLHFEPISIQRWRRPQELSLNPSNAVGNCGRPVNAVLAIRKLPNAKARSTVDAAAGRWEDAENTERIEGTGRQDAGVRGLREAGTGGGRLRENEKATSVAINTWG